MRYHEMVKNPVTAADFKKNDQIVAEGIEETYRTPGGNPQAAKVDAMRFAIHHRALLQFEFVADSDFDALDESFRWNRAIFMAETGSWGSMADLFRYHTRVLYEGVAVSGLLRDRLGVESVDDSDESANISYLNLARSLDELGKEVEFPN